MNAMTQAEKITLLQINDIHGYLEPHPELFWENGAPVYRTAGGLARIAARVRQIRGHNPSRTLLLDNGDTLHGTFPAVHSQGQALVPVLNYLGVDAMTGHWDFFYGLPALQARLTELNYPLLAINIRRQETADLIFPAFLIKEVGSLRIGILGIASNLVGRAFPAVEKAGINADLDVEEVRQAVHTLREREQVNLVVVLSHLGFPQDMQLAGEVAGIDVILSGHTHNRLYHPASQGKTLIIQSGSHGSFLGRLDLTVENGQVSDFSHDLIEIGEGIEPDPEAEALIQSALQPYRDQLSQVVGQTDVPLDRGLNQESTMDNLLLEAIAASMDTRLAFSNGWRYGVPVLPGPVTLNDLYNIIPVNPPVSSVELTGREIWDMLEENLEHTYARQPFNQMGGYLKRALGLQATFKVENPYPHRLQSLAIGGEEVQLNKLYPAAFVTRQGVPDRYGHNRQEHGLLAVDALRQYLANHRPIQIQLKHPFVMV
jgi:S-sulfosulfanyl-L-cysteine sulfohydrolase